jgi:hypothetical protein
MGKLDDLISAVGKAAPESKYIRAYHGSPHSFDRFDSSRIGAGEGAQAYGHGLYFAGKEDVARSYRDITPAMPSAEVVEALRRIEDRMQTLRMRKSQLEYEISDAADSGGVSAPGWGDIKTPPPEVSQRLGPQLEQVSLELDMLGWEQIAAQHGRGHMYEVEIPHPAEALLDYDRPFSTPVGRLALSAVGDMLPTPPSRSLTRDLRQGMGVEAAPRPGSRNAFDNAAGQLIDLAKTPSGAGALLDAGIPGVRYMDGFSRRGAQLRQPTRNYVMFPGTEDSIRILRKFGLMAPVAAGAASQYGE